MPWCETADTRSLACFRGSGPAIGRPQGGRWYRRSAPALTDAGRSRALPTPPAKVLYIKAAAANVRGGPSSDAAVLTTVKRTTKVVVLENGNAWYRVKLENGSEGWVAASTSTEPQH